MSSYPLPSCGGTPPILRGERHAEYSYTIYTKWKRDRLPMLSYLNGGIKPRSPLKIGGVPPLAGRGYEMKLRVYSYIVAKDNHPQSSQFSCE